MGKRVLQMLAILFGVVGVAISVATIVGVWWFGARLSLGTKRVFTSIEGALAGVQQRVSQVEDKVHAAKLTGNEVKQHVKQWTQLEIKQQVAQRLGVEEKTNQLAAGLQQADHWLELTESSLQLVQQGLEMSSSLGVHVQSEPAERLLTEVSELRTQLNGVTASVTQVQQRLSGEQSNESRMQQLIDLTLRIVATLGNLETRLGKLQQRLAEVQSRTSEAGGAAQHWIRTAEIGLSLLIGWMAAGQCALAYLGWPTHGRKQPNSPA